MKKQTCIRSMDLSSRASIVNLIVEAQKYGGISMLVNAAEELLNLPLLQPEKKNETE